jgi:putative hydrolase of the HAD superfamily
VEVWQIFGRSRYAPTVGSNKFDAVTFDVGGTLLYSDPTPAEIYATHLSRLGREVRAEEVGPVFAAAWSDMQRRTSPGADRYAAIPGGERAWWGTFVREVLVRLDHDAPWENLLDNLYRAFSEDSVWRTYPHALETLDGLAERGVTLAVISNWDRRLPQILRGLDLEDRFEVVTVSSLAGVEKPASEIFERTLDRLGVAAHRTLHVGDSPLEDYSGAENAGLAAALIDRSGAFSGQPYRRIAGLAEVLELVG